MHEEMVITERELMVAKNGRDSALGREGKNAGKVFFSKLQPLFLGIIVTSHFRDTPR